MAKLVKLNQSAFIRGRAIHDNFRMVQASAKLLHACRHACILLKVDIAKAFDTVNWTFLLELLHHLGFSRRWNNWISILLSTTIMKILLNGTPGRRICHARGLRQGDPLSPLMFVLTMEALNALFQLAEERLLLTSLRSPKIQHRASLYADDLVIFLSSVVQDLRAVGMIMETFAGASGLHTNIHKCQFTLIQCSEDQVAMVQQCFPCQLVHFPCKYLGVPLSIYKLKKSYLQPLVDSMVDRLPT
jgi:hypothetical protein